MKIVAINIRVHISFQINIFKFWGQIPRRRIAGSYGKIFSEIFKKLFAIVAIPVSIPIGSE